LLYLNHFILLCCCCVSIELFFKKNSFDLFYAIIKISKKSLKIIKSSNISDHWKEKVIPHYALLILKLSIIMFFILLLILLIFFIPLFFIPNYNDFILSINFILESLFISFIYIKLMKPNAK